MCRHIYHLDTEVKVLTLIKWDQYIMMFAERGMVVYETIGLILRPRSRPIQQTPMLFDFENVWNVPTKGLCYTRSNGADEY